ncbi:unnamed protein product, partial [Prunus brigantina]
MPERYYGFLHENEGELNLLSDCKDIEDPLNYNEAMSDIDSQKWLGAMKSEIDSMYTNQVWTLVDPPLGIVPIGNKWIFKRKIGSDGKVETYKARLVAKGYKQREGIDYEETFSPVAMTKSIRILLAIAAYHDYEVWQMDVKTAFLNGHLQEELYMDQPEGFISKADKHKVCKLHKSIYGLKQASRSWNIRFDEVVKSFDFIQNMDDQCVYKKVSGSSVVFLILHGLHLSKNMCPKTPEEIQQMSKIPYASAIGSLMYAMVCTRPDISYAVSVTSRYQSNPGLDHWGAVKCILKYLRRTKDMFLVYGGTSELQVEAFTDSDFASDVDDRKSTSGYVFILNGGVVSWRSCKQSVTADSTTEAEYVAASEAAKEAVW